MISNNRHVCLKQNSQKEPSEETISVSTNSGTGNLKVHPKEEDDLLEFNLARGRRARTLRRGALGDLLRGHFLRSLFLRRHIG
jgi:hypothetical protein